MEYVAMILLLTSIFQAFDQRQKHKALMRWLTKYGELQDKHIKLQGDYLSLLASTTQQIQTPSQPSSEGSARGGEGVNQEKETHQ